MTALERTVEYLLDLHGGFTKDPPGDLGHYTEDITEVWRQKGLGPGRYQIIMGMLFKEYPEIKATLLKIQNEYGAPDESELTETPEDTDDALPTETTVSAQQKPVESKADLSEAEVVPHIPDEPIRPPLPDIGLNPDDAKNTGRWIDVYSDYASVVSPKTPRLFHTSAAYMLLSMVVARRLKLSMSWDDIYPNLYMLWVAPSTLYSKSTALKVAKSIIKEKMPYLLLSDNMTPEAMRKSMSGTTYQFSEDDLSVLKDEAPKQYEFLTGARSFAAQRSLVLDEASGLFANAKKDYNAGLIEFILQAFDCGDYRSETISRGLEMIDNMYMSFLGASTPIAMSPYLGDSVLAQGGFWQRFVLLTPDEAPSNVRPDDQVPQRPPEILDQLMRLFNRLPSDFEMNDPPALSVSLSRDAFDLWANYQEKISFDLFKELDPVHHSSYGRMSTRTLKLAILLAALDWPEGHKTPRIELSHMTRAILQMEEWRESYHRTMLNAHLSEYDRIQERIVAYLGVNQRSTARQIYKSLKEKAQSVNSILDALVKNGTVSEYKSGRTKVFELNES